MSNFNDGQWHSWDGGECPVHPETEVEAVWHDPGLEQTGIRRGAAKGGAWRNQILRFRVTKEYREPREWWIKPTCNHPRICDVEPDRPHAYIRVREVL